MIFPRENLMEHLFFPSGYDEGSSRVNYLAKRV